MTYETGMVRAHGTTELRVGYTNESTTMPNFLGRFQAWVDTVPEPEAFLGLDLEYTADQQGVVVIQLCFKQYVLIFQWAR